jgi:hypothetical protein
MPTFANFPNAGRPYRTSDQSRHTISGSPLLRLRVAIHRDSLDRELAQGADPSARPELALRAAQLTSPRSRRRLARSLSRSITEAHRPQMTRSRVTIIRRGAVLDAEDALRVTIDRLNDSAPVSPEGMAIVERFVTNADSSPLYNPAEPGALRRLAVLATAAMDPGSSAPDTLRFAA